MHQSTTLLLLTMMVLQLATTCPLPTETTETCPSLPQESLSYLQHVQALRTSNDFSLNLNASHADRAFRTLSVEEVREGSLGNISAGCSGNVEYTTVVDGKTGSALSLTCPHTFLCDYNPQRVPAHVYHARCNSSSRSLSDGSKCQEVFYPVVTMTTESCDPLNDETTWQLKTEQVAVSCVHIAAE